MPDNLIEEIRGGIKEGFTATQKKFEDAHKELDGRVAELAKQLDEQKKANVEAKTEYQKSVEKVEKAEAELADLEQKMLNRLPGGTPEQKTLGQHAAECEEIKNFRGGNMVLADVDGASQLKAVDSGGDSAGDLVVPYRQPGIAYDPTHQPVIRDLLTVLSVSSNSIEWAREDVFTNKAGAPSSENAVRPESDITFTKETTPVVTIGHWIPVSRQILSDAPALRSHIDMRMTQGLKIKESQEILFGDGTNGRLHGLYPQATAYDTGLNKAGYTNIDQIRKAHLQASLSAYPSTATVMSLTDWAEIQLTKDDNNNYLFGSPANPAANRVWGKTVVESIDMTPSDGATGGQFLVGGFGLGATLWDRAQMTVRVAEQHENYFVRGMVALLVEERLALTVERPKAFVKGNFVVA